MPLFQYHCAQCGLDQELLVRGKESPACENCGSSRLVKQVSYVAALTGGGSESMGCGAESCCRLQGNSCMN